MGRADDAVVIGRDAEQFRQMFEHAPIGIYVSDPNGRLIQVNSAFCRMLGYSEPELTGAAWSELTYPDDLGPASVRKEHLWSGVLDSFEAETRFVHRTGAVVWTRIHVSRIRGAGARAYSLVHVEDITDGKLTRNALEESEARFRIMADGCPTMLWVTTAAGETQLINRAFREFFGLECDQIERSDWRLLIHPDERNAYVNAFDGAVRGHAPFEAEARVRRADGEWRWINSRADPRFSPDGEFLGLVGLSPDITARKDAERQLRISEEKFRQFTANIDEVFWLTDPSGVELQYVSPAYESIWGRSCADLYANPKSWIESIHPEDRASAERVFLRQLQGEGVENEYRILQPSGAVRWIRDRAFAIRDDGGNIVRVGGVAQDTTERTAREVLVLHQALHDDLTGLPNRNLFRKKMDEALAEVLPGQCGAVFFIDLDEFKLVNEALGHSAGDLLLSQVGQRFAAVCPASGTLARFGCDQFMLLAARFEERREIVQLGEDLRRALDRPFNIAGRDIFIGASIGSSVFPDDGAEPDALKRNADLAMHEAKRTGKNQVRFFTPVLGDAIRERLDIEMRLRRAFEMSEFKLQLQPQFPASGLYPARFEALLRWCPPEASVVPPSKFIPILEQNGMIVPIGAWALEEACRRCLAWQCGSLKGAGVAVNVSARQFADPDFLNTVRQTLKTTGLRPQLLEIELTESVLLQDVRTAAETLARLRDLGVTVALDDFGTGYSSLSYLHNLPLDALKIDRSFLVDNESRPQGFAVLRCVVQLAHSLGLRVVGEGVETEAQLDLLASLGCDEVQGYLLGRPAFDVNGVRPSGLKRALRAVPQALMTAQDKPPVFNETALSSMGQNVFQAAYE
jgi:diguanylate cyclase (GGDEF)-like protein/PAS domain S-box-containing protein